MPASIERSIREENLRFMQNRDVFSEDYYSFLYEVNIGMDLLQKLSCHGLCFSNKLYSISS